MGLEFNIRARLVMLWIRDDCTGLLFVTGAIPKYFGEIRAIYYRWEIAYATIVQMAAPAILPQIGKSPGTISEATFSPVGVFKVEWIQMNVVGNVYKVGVAHYVLLSEHTLPKDSRTFVLFVKVFCVSHIELLHE